MDLADLAKTVAKFGAPILGGVLLGPAGAAAGAALAAKFGADSIEPATIAQKIETDPEAPQKLLELEKLDFERDKAYLGDKQNARQLQIELAKAAAATGQKVDASIPAKLSFLFIGGYFFLAIVVIAAICFANVSKEELEPVLQILKDLGMAVMLILSYWFGAMYNKKD